MVNALKKNFSPIKPGIYGKSTKCSTQRCYQANEGKSDLEVERVQALGALRSLRSKKKLGTEKRRQTHFIRNEMKEKWIEHYVERETAGARKRVEDAEAAIRPEQGDAQVAENIGLTTRKREKMFHEIMVAIGGSLSNISSSDNGHGGVNGDDEETEQGQLSEDDEPGWVVGTITKTV